MRRAISNISSRQGNTVAVDICLSLRQIQHFFQRIYVPYSGPRDFSAVLASKVEVMNTNVSKVEMACYNNHVRGREKPEGWRIELKEDYVFRHVEQDEIADDEFGRAKRRRLNED